jgi:hypothetical protein
MQIAFYKQSSKGLLKKLVHYGICLATLSRYSHCELVINGLCYSSSGRDHGVRKKYIPDLYSSGHWDVFDIAYDEDYALKVYEYNKLGKYDYFGVARYIFPFIPNIRNKWYCSELVAVMLGLPKEQTPQDLFNTLIVKKYTL